MCQRTSVLKAWSTPISPSSHVSRSGHMNELKSVLRRLCYRYPKATKLRCPEMSCITEEPKQDLASAIGPVVEPFIRGLGYRPSTNLDNNNHLLWSGSLTKVADMDMPCPENSPNWKRLKVGISYAHHCYSNHPLEVQVYVAVYTLFAQLLDDWTPDATQDIEKFFQRLCAGEEQPTSALKGWAQLMREAHQHWSPIPANLIISSSLNMVTSTIIEHDRVVRKDRQCRSGRTWAYYLRNMDGLGDAFAAFTFPSALYPDVSQYIQAIPDMAMYIVHANDVISFYKEELLGEEDNYAHSRARYDGKDVIATIKDIIQETEACYQRIRGILSSGGSEGQTYAKAWRNHEQGYVDFHMFSGRYKLEELGLAF